MFGFRKGVRDAEPVRRYGGTLVYCRRDTEGLIEVVDSYGVRALHFGTPPRQSAMALAEPERLELSYVRAMLAGLMFTPGPRRVLALGLGGGSLAKFLARNFPDCRIEVVEFRTAVVEVAHRYFGLPEAPNLAIHIGDAREFVRREALAGASLYDHIFVDIYDDRGLSASVNERDFFAACARLLEPSGVFALNLWGSDRDSYREAVDLLRQYYGSHTLRLPVIGRGNIIGFGFGPDVPKPDLERLRPVSRGLEARLGVEFPRLLRSMVPMGWR